MKLLTTNASDKPLYRILGLPDDIPEDLIHAAFLNISRAHHPDVTGGKPTDFFMKCKHAHDVLMDPLKRQIYDETGLDPDESDNDDQVLAIASLRQIFLGLLADGEVDCNVLQRIQRTLDGDAKTKRIEIERSKQAIAKTEKMASNIRRRFKGPASIKGSMIGAVEAEIERLTSEKVLLEDDLRNINLARNLADSCDYDAPPQPTRNPFERAGSMHGIGRL
jgi:curved DNA-binding protein CbpA